MAGVGPFPSITKYFGENNTYRWIYQPDGGGAGEVGDVDVIKATIMFRTNFASSPVNVANATPVEG